MTDIGKREDRMLDVISKQGRAIKRARRLIEEFALADANLWPILSEIDKALDSASDE